MIPTRLIRTVPEETTEEVEAWWVQARLLHPHWTHITLRDPVHRSSFPLTSSFWDTCESGAQLADLIRLEELYHRGGVYIDSDYEAWRPFDSLTGLKAFAAWEDEHHVPNAVMGFPPRHPALMDAIDMARLRHDHGTWEAGVGVTTEVFPQHSDIVLFPPGTFYPVHYRVKNLVDWSKVQEQNPWAYGAHRWRHSWAS